MSENIQKEELLPTEFKDRVFLPKRFTEPGVDMTFEESDADPAAARSLMSWTFPEELPEAIKSS